MTTETKAKLKGFKVFMSEEQIDKLDAEVLRRRQSRENVDEEGKKIHVNRSTILRELADTLP